MLFYLYLGTDYFNSNRFTLDLGPFFRITKYETLDSSPIPINGFDDFKNQPFPFIDNISR